MYVYVVSKRQRRIEAKYIYTLNIYIKVWRVEENHYIQSHLAVRMGRVGSWQPPKIQERFATHPFLELLAKSCLQRAERPRRGKVIHMDISNICSFPAIVWLYECTCVCVCEKSYTL